MPRTPIPKQEKVCQQFISTGNASEAYRQRYDCSKMKNTTISRTAHGLFKTARSVQESGNYRKKVGSVTTLQPVSKRNSYRTHIVGRCRRDMPPAAVGATWALAKLHGLDKSSLKSPQKLYPDIDIRATRDPQPMGRF